MSRYGCLLVSILAACPHESLAQPPITALAFSPDGGSVLVGSQSGIEVRSWPDLKPEHTIDSALSHIHDIALSNDRFAVVGGDPSEQGTVEIYAWPGGKRLSRQTSRHSDVIYAAAWSEDGRELATAAADSLVVVGGVDDDQSMRSLQGHSRGVLAVAFVPQTELLISGGLDNRLRVWNRTTHQVQRVLDNHRGIVRDLAVRPEAEGLPMVASASADRTVRFWQPTIGRMVRYARLPAEPLSIAWTTDGRQLAVGCVDGHLRIVNAEDVTVETDTAVIDGWAYEVAVSPRGKGIAVAGAQGQVVKLGENKKIGRADRATTSAPTSDGLPRPKQDAG